MLHHRSSISTLSALLTTISMAHATWEPTHRCLYKVDNKYIKRAESTTTKKKSTTTKKKSTTATTIKKTSSQKDIKTSMTLSTFSFISSTSTTTITMTPTNTTAPLSASSSSSHTNTGAIVGGIIAGIAVIIMSVTLFLVMRRKKKQQEIRHKPDPFSMGFGSHDPPMKSYTETSLDQYKPKASSLGLYQVVATYTPTLGDELEVDVGDEIELLVEYGDGWCQGINITKHSNKGVFPRHCIQTTLKMKRASSMIR